MLKWAEIFQYCNCVFKCFQIYVSLKVEPEGDPENSQATETDVNDRISNLEVLNSSNLYPLSLIFLLQNELANQLNELKNIKMRLKGGSVDNNASAAFFDAIFEDPEAKES